MPSFPEPLEICQIKDLTPQKAVFAGLDFQCLRNKSFVTAKK